MSQIKSTGLFDHMPASIKWIRVKYQQNPPGVGLLEVGYVEADGQEHMKKYSLGIIGTTHSGKYHCPHVNSSQIGFVVACISDTCCLAI